MKYCIGCDPDLHSTAIALVQRDPASEEFKVLAATVVRTSTDKKRNRAVEELINKRRHKINEFYRSVEIEEDPRCVIESQEMVYSSRSGANPRDLLPIATVTGVMAQYLADYCLEVVLPLPSEWKGQVPKAVNHARTASLLGWETKTMGGKKPYLCPVSGHEEIRLTGKVNPGDWKHLMDAIGLAIWGLKQKG